MQINLYHYSDDKIQTEIDAYLEFGKISIYGHDTYLPNELLPDGSEYEYEIFLDATSTKQLLDLIAPGKSDAEILNLIKDMFQGKGADIRFQSFCLEHQIETYCSSYFDD